MLLYPSQYWPGSQFAGGSAQLVTGVLNATAAPASTSALAIRPSRFRTSDLLDSPWGTNNVIFATFWPSSNRELRTVDRIDRDEGADRFAVKSAGLPNRIPQCDDQRQRQRVWRSQNGLHRRFVEFLCESPWRRGVPAANARASASRSLVGAHSRSPAAAKAR
jgi:hypothetical protein